MAEDQQAKDSHETDDKSTMVLPRKYGQLVGSDTTSKTSWPEAVGFTAEEAEKKIKEDMPQAQIQVVRPGSFVTMEFNRGRVRIYLGDSGKVQKPPIIG